MYLLGVSIRENQFIKYGLTNFFGIGVSMSLQILKELKIDGWTKVKDLSKDQLNEIQTLLSKLKIEGKLKREVSLNINRLVQIKCYRGVRHIKRLPVHGQRTRSNSRTRKGPKKTVANKKKAPKQ